MSALQAEPTKKAAQQCAVAVEPCRLHADQCCSCGRPTKAVRVSPTVRTVMFLAVLGILTMALFPVVVVRIIALTKMLNHNSAAGLRSVNSNLTMQAEMSGIAIGLNGSTVPPDAGAALRVAVETLPLAAESHRHPIAESAESDAVLRREAPTARPAPLPQASEPVLPAVADRSRSHGVPTQ